MLRLLLLVALAVSAGACRRPCETEQNCKRTCECLDNTTDTRIDCTIAFRCEGETQVCEPEYDSLSCDDLCTTYAARGVCGTERCSSNADCVKILTCPVLDANNQPVLPEQFFNCTRTFECDLTLEICNAEITASDEAHCAFCRATGGQGG